jgi:hypothetical protein
MRIMDRLSYKERDMTALRQRQSGHECEEPPAEDCELGMGHEMEIF